MINMASTISLKINIVKSGNIKTMQVRAGFKRHPAITWLVSNTVALSNRPYCIWHDWSVVCTNTEC